jgi:peptide/nickel transport system substrate-binding protein
MNGKQLSAVATHICKRLRPRAFARGLPMVSTALLLAAVPVVTAACGGSSSGTAGPQVSTLKIAVTSPPSSNNPATSTGFRTYSSIFYSLAYAALFHDTPTGKIQPQLATSWHYVNSGTHTRNEEFEFTLRRNAKFADGTPVTAQAVVQWLQYFVKSPGVAAGDFGPGATFTASGPLTVRIKLTSPNPDLPFLMSDEGDNAGLVVSPKAIAHPSMLTSGTDGAGQYQVLASQSVNNDHYTFVPNPNYYNKPAVRFKQVYLKVIPNPSSRLEAQQSGQYDVTLGDATTAATAKSAGLQVLSAPIGTVFLWFDINPNHQVAAPALRNVKVRQAINYAINRAAIAKALFGTSATPKSGIMTLDGNTGTGPADVDYPYDPAKAKQLLAQAGYSHGLTLKAIYPAYYGNFSTPLVSAVAENLQAVGIQLQSSSYPTQGAYGTVVVGFKNPVVHAVMPLDSTPANYDLYLAPKSSLNWIGTDPEIERLYQQGAASSDPNVAWSKMWQRFTSLAYTVPLVDQPDFYYVSKGIGGVSLSNVYNTSLPTDWYPTGK